MTYTRTPEPKRNRLLELGPAWITAIAGVITAMTAAGFFACRVTSHEGNPGIAPSTAPSPESISAPIESEAERPQWPGEPAGSIFITGSPDLTSSGDNALDLDTNDVAWDQHATSEFDMNATDDGVGALNGAVFAPWPGAQLPTLSDCRATPEESWITSIGVDRFKTPTTFCVQSAEGRFGYIQTRRVTFFSDQDVDTLRLGFVLWKKPGDR